jgi:hypothetical protein
MNGALCRTSASEILDARNVENIAHAARGPVVGDRALSECRCPIFQWPVVDYVSTGSPVRRRDKLVTEGSPSPPNSDGFARHSYEH